MEKNITLETIEKELEQFGANNLIFIPDNTSFLDIIRGRDRRQEYVLLRVFLIKKLKDELGWGFARINRFMNATHPSAHQHYYGTNKGRGEKYRKSQSGISKMGGEEKDNTANPFQSR